MARLSGFAFGFLMFACGGSSGGDSGSDTGRIGEGGSGGSGAASGAGGSDVDPSGSGGSAGSAAGSGGTLDGPRATQELSQNAEEGCAATCEKSVECIPQGSSTVPECVGRCLADATAAAESEQCAELMLAVFDCVAAAECSGLEAACGGAFDEATRCAGTGGRMCSMAQPELAGPPAPGDVMCSQSCEASGTTPTQETECAYGEQSWTCSCTQGGEALPEVMAESCEAAFELCFP